MRKAPTVPQPEKRIVSHLSVTTLHLVYRALMTLLALLRVKPVHAALLYNQRENRNNKTNTYLPTYFRTTA